MNTSDIQTRDLVLVGGGHTHALVLRMWGMTRLPGARVTVINPGPTAPYSGMLPGFVAGHYTRGDLDIDLVQLARFAGARVVLGTVSGVDRPRREIHVPGRPPIGYDVLSIDVGLTADMPGLPGFAEHAVPAKPLGPFAAAWEGARAADSPVVVLGGGVAGVELALAMAQARQGRGTVSLVDRGRLLSALPKYPRALIIRALHRYGVQVFENKEVASVSVTHVHLKDGPDLPAGFVTGAAGGRAWPWLSDLGLPTQDGFLKVSARLQTADPDIFAAGDCAHMTDAPRPKAGVFAVRQAPVLLHNLRAALTGGSLRAYKPQRDYLKLVSLGGKRALAEKAGLPLVGRGMWRWKNHIDQTFMTQFKDLKPMDPPPPPKLRALGPRPVQPLCTGCGAKVGRATLRDAIAQPGLVRGDITALPGDDAALLHMGGVQQVLTTDHLSAVTEDPAVFARIAAIHALGDVWAMGAAPQAVLAQIMLPRLSPDLQARTLAEIMAAATTEITRAGAQIVGGHTTQGDALTVGFTVSGLCEGAPVTLAGACPGDALILTKPLGTGVILAAEMQIKAPGAVVQAALRSMTQSQVAAAEILRGAHAMTDVTGFGLAGHLEAMMQASAARACLDLAAVPLLPGVQALSDAGVRSSLFADNRALVPDLPEEARTRVLFDPQTAGGLLAAVAKDQAPNILLRLQKAGFDAHQIGEVQEGAPGLVLL